VVFLAGATAGLADQVLRFDAGVLSKVAQVGDAAPAFGNYAQVDWTLPDIDDNGAVIFTATESAFSILGTVLVDVAGAQWVVKYGDATGSGALVFQVHDAVFGANGELAFLASTGLPWPSGSGWFVGTPGNWRKAIEQGDALAGGSVTTLVTLLGGTPRSPLNAAGDLALWCEITAGALTEQWLVLAREDGTLVPLKQRGGPTSIGGTVGALSSNPSINAAGQVLLHCVVSGASGVAGACFVLDPCAPPESYCTPGTTLHGCSARLDWNGTASASAPSGFTIQVGGSSFLCVKSPLQRTQVQASGGASGTCDGSLALDFNAFRAANASALGQPMFAGQAFQSQAWFRDPGSVKNTSLSDALEFWLAP
jgi:hypothetical protein